MARTDIIPSGNDLPTRSDQRRMVDAARTTDLQERVSDELTKRAAEYKQDIYVAGTYTVREGVVRARDIARACPHPDDQVTVNKFVDRTRDGFESSVERTMEMGYAAVDAAHYEFLRRHAK